MWPGAFRAPALSDSTHREGEPRTFDRRLVGPRLSAYFHRIRAAFRLSYILIVLGLRSSSDSKNIECRVRGAPSSGLRRR